MVGWNGEKEQPKDPWKPHWWFQICLISSDAHEIVIAMGNVMITGWILMEFQGFYGIYMHIPIYIYIYLHIHIHIHIYICDYIIYDYIIFDYVHIYIYHMRIYLYIYTPYIFRQAHFRFLTAPAARTPRAGTSTTPLRGNPLPATLGGWVWRRRSSYFDIGTISGSL